MRNLEFEYERFNNPVVVQNDCISMKTKKPGIIDIRFDEKLFLNNILVFNPHSEYKHYNECISQKFINLSTIDQIPLKRDCIDGSVVNGLRQPILFRFVLDKPHG